MHFYTLSSVAKGRTLIFIRASEEEEITKWKRFRVTENGVWSVPQTLDIWDHIGFLR